MTWLRKYLSHAVGFHSATAGILQLLQRLRIEVCLSIVEKIFFDYKCVGEKTSECSIGLEVFPAHAVLAGH